MENHTLQVTFDNARLSRLRIFLGVFAGLPSHLGTWEEEAFGLRVLTFHLLPSTKIEPAECSYEA